MPKSHFDELKSFIESTYISHAATSSKLWGEARDEIKSMRRALENMEKQTIVMENQINTAIKDLNRVDETFGRFEEEYRKEVLPHVNTWKSTADSTKWATRIVVGSVLLGLLTLLGLK